MNDTQPSQETNTFPTSNVNKDGAVPSGFILKLFQMVNGAPDEIISVSSPIVNIFLFVLSYSQSSRFRTRPCPVDISLLNLCALEGCCECGAAVIERSPCFDRFPAHKIKMSVVFSSKEHWLGFRPFGKCSKEKRAMEAELSFIKIQVIPAISPGVPIRFISRSFPDRPSWCAPTTEKNQEPRRSFA